MMSPNDGPFNEAIEAAAACLIPAPTYVEASMVIENSRTDYGALVGSEKSGGVWHEDIHPRRSCRITCMWGVQRAGADSGTVGNGAGVLPRWPECRRPE